MHNNIINKYEPDSIKHEPHGIVVPMCRVDADELQRVNNAWLKRNFMHGLLASEKQEIKPLELREFNHA